MRRCVRFTIGVKEPQDRHRNLPVTGIIHALDEACPAGVLLTGLLASHFRLIPSAEAAHF
jgi:hypothetical protein